MMFCHGSAVAFCFDCVIHVSDGRECTHLTGGRTNCPVRGEILIRDIPLLRCEWHLKLALVTVQRLPDRILKALREVQKDESEAGSQLAALVRGESDLGLLKLMARRGEDEIWADAAFCEFYDRHKGYLWTVCRNACEALHGEAWHEDIWQDTFTRAYDKAGTFSLPAGVSPERTTLLVRGWLGQIANNLLRSLLRNHECEYSQDEDGWERILDTVGSASETEESVSPGKQEERKLIDVALETLSEREQLVLRRTFQYYRIGKEFQRLPNKVVQELADQLATTPENLRKIRERALTKVKDYVNQYHTDVRSSRSQ